MACLMVLVGVAGRILLASAANIEPVLVLSMLAGALLGGYYVLVVPVAIMGLSDLYFYMVPYEGLYATGSILGLAAFVYSGYVFVAWMGGFAMRRRILWRTKTIALLTTISIPLTVAFDVWTAFGDWLFLGSGQGLPLARVYEMQVPFTLIHVFSSLLFAPILGTTFLALCVHGVPVPQESDAETIHET
ncbi:MAG TPA: DUF6580 family putative transport protein [Thermoplasmata archaeon]|nr:DUF6580 family putative transport protein [Thermoplasmata archaeon]